MLQLKLTRTKFFSTHTIGQLYVKDDFFCFVLEDVVRDVKIPKETAIPYGTYSVVLQYSPRFGADCLTILNVPNYTGVRIHAGNSAADTDGCLILGYQLTEANIIRPGTTRPAVSDLRAIVKRAIESNVRVELEIKKL